MLFQHQQQQQRQHEFQHLKTHLFPQWQSDSSNNPLIQTPTAQTLPQPVKKRSYTAAGGRGGGGASRAALRNAGGVGEIVEVQGGHILRSTGRKDRHSKVCTAKGPRDRRVRLSANTAIQFYDVQDRLGYDRPSKAVDWLMKKAKAAIDELDELPAWKPSATKPKSPADADSPSAGVYNNDNGSGGLLPPSLESDAIADTIKSFFPLNGAVSEAQSTQFEPYPNTSNHHNSSSSGSQDLKLSLQSFQDPMLIGFDNPSSGWGGGGGGFMVIPPPQAAAAQQLFHHQRGPLQSSNTPNPVRAWIGGDYSIGSSSHDFHQAVSFSGIGAGFSGYCFPARIQGEDEEEHAGIPVKPSSASSASRH